MSQGKRSVILLIEADSSLRRLISLGLQQRGTEVIEASSPRRVPTCDIQQLDALVLDLDNGISRHDAFLETLQAHAQLATLPTVVLAWDAPSFAEMSSALVTTVPSRTTYLPKPFDARALYRVLDQLLQAQAAEQAYAEARAEELLLASYAQQTAPSIWPLITAAGLLFLVTGLLLHPALCVLGMLIVMVALCYWTLGTKPSVHELPAGA